MRFKVGDEVRWFSCSAGVRREKRGVVEHVLAPGERPAPRVSIRGVERRSSRSWGSSRNHESYVVRARALGTLTEKPRLYWPHVKLLERCKKEDRAQENMGGVPGPSDA